MFHIFKVTRVYQGEPYCGYSSSFIPAEAATLEKAIEIAKALQKRNPVGWNVYDATTRKLVYGYDLFTGKKIEIPPFT